MVYVDDVIGEVRPHYDKDNVAFETAEVYASVGGRFGFPLFSNATSRSQEYDRAADRGARKALAKVR